MATLFWKKGLIWLVIVAPVLPVFFFYGQEAPKGFKEDIRGSHGDCGNGFQPLSHTDR